MDKVCFLTTGQGITSTLANHLCNIAKEEMQSIQSALDNIAFHNIYVELLSGEQSKQIRQGYTAEELQEVIAKVEYQAKLTAFIAYFRECIKQKEAIIERIKALAVDDYERLQKLEPLAIPRQPRELTLDEYIAECHSLEEYQEYYHIGALAAAYGKTVHPGQAFSIAKTDFNKRAKNTIDVEGTGEQTIIRRYEATIDQQALEKVFFEQQANYRDYQARANKLKAEYEEKHYLYTKQQTDAYNQEYAIYRQALADRFELYARYQEEEIRRIGSLKIVVPERLQETFNLLRSLGKDGSL